MLSEYIAETLKKIFADVGVDITNVYDKSDGIIINMNVSTSNGLYFKISNLRNINILCFFIQLDGESIGDCYIETKHITELETRLRRRLKNIGRKLLEKNALNKRACQLVSCWVDSKTVDAIENTLDKTFGKKKRVANVLYYYLGQFYMVIYYTLRNKFTAALYFNKARAKPLVTEYTETLTSDFFNKAIDSICKRKLDNKADLILKLSAYASKIN
jgi:hypothetical protein